MGGGGEIQGTGGVKPMSIAGRVVRERERLSPGMTPEERLWRKKWLQDQNLTPHEPVHVKAARKELLNPIRRLYRAPLDFVFGKLVGPIIGQAEAGVLRFYTGRGLMGIWGVFAGFYYFKYNTNTWQGKGRWRVIKAKEAVYPGHPEYPKVNPVKQPHEYHDREFSKSVFGQKFPQYQKGE